MSAPDDKVPPPERETQPEIHDTDRPPPLEVGPIHAGKAKLAVALAFAAVSRAIADLENAALALEATATACARQLDASVTEAGR